MKLNAKRRDRADALSSGDVKQFPGILQTAMHPRVNKIALLCWICFQGAFWAISWMSANALFMVMLGTVYVIVVR